jgi:hypothetical protein
MNILKSNQAIRLIHEVKNKKILRFDVVYKRFIPHSFLLHFCSNFGFLRCENISFYIFLLIGLLLYSCEGEFQHYFCLKGNLLHKRVISEE